MKRLSLVASIFFSLGAFAGTESTELTCPTDREKATIDQWRDKAIEKVLHGDYGIVKEAFTKCFPDQIPSCLADVESFNSDRSSTGNEAYYSDPPSSEADLTLKSEKDLPREFLVKDWKLSIKPGLVAFPPNLMNLAKEKGWKAVAYKTRGSGGFDEGPNLTMVVIPGTDKDIYMQISPLPVQSDKPMSAPAVFPGDPSHGQYALTIITVDKTKTPPVGQLRILHKNEDNAPYSWTNQTDISSCTSCHSSPLRSISPRGYLVVNGDESRMSPEDEQKVTEINEMMLVNNLSFGQRTGTDGHRHNLGPSPSSQPLGWAPENSETRKEAFIKSCANSSQSTTITGFGGYSATFNPSPNMANVDWKKISDNMNCINCHNNTIRGYLHSGFSSKEVRFKILVDRSMPPSTVLTGDERLALANCLLAERERVSGEWKQSGAWMKRKFCEATNADRQRRRPPAQPGGAPSNSTNKVQ